MISIWRLSLKSTLYWWSKPARWTGCINFCLFFTGPHVVSLWTDKGLNPYLYISVKNRVGLEEQLSLIVYQIKSLKLPRYTVNRSECKTYFTVQHYLKLLHYVTIILYVSVNVYRCMYRKSVVPSSLKSKEPEITGRFAQKQWTSPFNLIYEWFAGS